MSAAKKLSRILVVEDNSADVFLIKKAIEECGIATEVVVCADGDSALDLIYSAPDGVRPDAIILDLSLPGLGGFDLLQKLRARPAITGVPVMIFTSSPAPTDRLRAEQLGKIRYVQKPSGLDRFLNAVAGNVRAMLSHGLETQTD